MASQPARRSPSLLAIGFFILVVFQGVKLDLPRVVTVPLPVAVDTAHGIAIAAKLGDAAISLSWR
ncbi:MULTISPECIES: hypothetical protein [unclassified Sphingomonas]|uniref:hypothetical protein n=1 Tax=unclassified Sphingomonas TaxID=196159 RepID=UPI0006FEC9A3|nr:MULTISPECIES: hypothetical protein [unclassified Sphingomonas]KQN00391.1 hypothetical protein ASE78_04555 [Sphingomonas sp. Leaf25]KQN36501.1 hypothetical protein ASE97_12175 [Sphingomonas sp. Leaf42]KQT27122.1 hypothetical protein ASG37_12920 [Sphingomonas sp. Leaf407]